MPKAIRFYENGGPEVLRYEELDPGKPAPEEAQVRHTAIGVNFIDVYDRTGLYPGELPGGLGREAAGIVTALGRKVRGFRVGDRVAYVTPKSGAYCEVRNVSADRLVKVPKGVSDQEAAALMLKGLTAQYLLRRTYRVARGDSILVHAAAGGVGSFLCQWARSLGAKVIGKRTMGKWNAQELYDLGNGWAMKYTTMVFRSPSGALPDGKGLEPDVEVEADKATVAKANTIRDGAKRIAADAQLRVATTLLKLNR